LYGTIEVNPRTEFRASPGTVHVHLLEPIPTDGLTYADRDELAGRVRQRMADCLRAHYGVDPAIEPARAIGSPSLRAPAPDFST
jgi:1-acyl-sn-glycerol-3-phosphate acyltransferase